MWCRMNLELLSYVSLCRKILLQGINLELVTPFLIVKVWQDSITYVDYTEMEEDRVLNVERVKQTCHDFPVLQERDDTDVSLLSPFDIVYGSGLLEKKIIRSLF